MGDRNDQTFWNSVAPEALMQACDGLGPEHKFDAVVVDEGQDFRELWWTSLEAVFRDPDAKGCYYVFYDPRRNQYVDKPSLPAEFGAPYPLAATAGTRPASPRTAPRWQGMSTGRGREHLRARNPRSFPFRRWTRHSGKRAESSGSCACPAGGD